jgi:hypothetical protein
VTTLIVAFRNFANACKNEYIIYCNNKIRDGWRSVRTGVAKGGTDVWCSTQARSAVRWRRGLLKWRYNKECSLT